eukprot:2234854-Amphidinium_carterae.1
MRVDGASAPCGDPTGSGISAAADIGSSVGWLQPWGCKDGSRSTEWLRACRSYGSALGVSSLQRNGARP